jgi:hypothetical protein
MERTGGILHTMSEELASVVVDSEDSVVVGSAEGGDSVAVGSAEGGDSVAVGSAEGATSERRTGYVKRQQLKEGEEEVTHGGSIHIAFLEISPSTESMER